MMINIKIEEIRDDFEMYYGKKREKANKTVKILMEDILKNGLQKPIDIHKIGDNLYEVVEGVHRLEACRRLGWKEIPCEILNYGPQPSPHPRGRYE